MRAYYVYRPFGTDPHGHYYANGHWTNDRDDRTEFRAYVIALSVADRLQSNGVDANVGVVNPLAHLKRRDPALAPQG